MRRISGDLEGVLVCVGGGSGNEAGSVAGDSSCTVELVEQI